MENLKASDLRVSNLVQHTIGKTRYGTIEEIRKNKVSIKFEFSRLQISINEIQPIPLTEVWLMRLPEDLVSEDIPSWIQFIHQLQNWYWIRNECKKELQLKQ